MHPIQITVTGRLGDDPRTFRTRDGSDGVELRLAIEVPARSSHGESVTRWVKVTAYGLLATRTAESVSRGDRLVVQADDMITETWSTDQGEPRSKITLRARDIAASMARDSLQTNYAARKAARQAAAKGEDTDLPAHEQAEAQVLAGVTA